MLTEPPQLRDISLSIKKGRKIALLGNNGKPLNLLLFQHLNGILSPTTGSILIESKKMNYDRKNLAFLSKKWALFFSDPDSQLFSGNVKQDISFGPAKFRLVERKGRSTSRMGNGTNRNN